MRTAQGNSNRYLLPGAFWVDEYLVLVFTPQGKIVEHKPVYKFCRDLSVALPRRGLGGERLENLRLAPIGIAANAIANDLECLHTKGAMRLSVQGNNKRPKLTAQWPAATHAPVEFAEADADTISQTCGGPHSCPLCFLFGC